MSKVSLAPAFPERGHWPSDLNEVIKQRYAQQREIAAHCVDARGEGKPADCALVMNVSLFFDGTNNHGDSDDAADPVCSTNIRRLYHATVGKDDAQSSGYFSYYIQGVGTCFPEIGEKKPLDSGLRYASGGDARIQWGITRLIDALHLATPLKSPSDKAMAELVEGMQYQYEKREKGPAVKYETKPDERRALVKKALKDVLAEQEKPDHKPKILKIKLFVYGFSRGAAEARAFLWRLGELIEDGALASFPIEVKFVGLLDTVASVGLTELAPGAQGHQGWADGTMKLPPWLPADCCVHLVSAHEQRLCFPLDSVGTDAVGAYPASVKGEWVYPGMHSDVGGGYPPKDQGKALGGQSLLLSQFALQHLYSLAFASDAPLKINEDKLISPNSQQLQMLKSKEPWRFMEDSLKKLFDVDSVLAQRFNAWQTFSTKHLPASRKEEGPVEAIMRAQAAQINAWRIERFSGGLQGKGGQDQSHSDFYQYASKERQTPEWRVKEEKRIWDKQSGKGKPAIPEPLLDEDKKPRLDENGNPIEWKPNLNKAYEPTLDKVQLDLGATDFTNDYLDRASLANKGNFVGILTSILTSPSRLFSADKIMDEFPLLKRDSEALYADVVADKELMALYDDHVHDSRAWFMQSSLDKLEPGGTYWRYRTIFFTDDINNKQQLDKLPEVKAERERREREKEMKRMYSGG
ncbi:T6SS phospholipase effector Tle1-like catalytic domain-containing protein [Chromobacterium piscinae]|uniref:T6SS phospholipase effector Tle1-like catalytic domain-containing protein n=1 Tax=Chromobacterium piscinae TaxID=686831 RepID=UPI001C8C233E|nr:DUF2235 domain-containing protein [Chromobacterium piscinae]MBX9348156.1 DUF2235 domain-containing protein [Chromobacterium vaccinii]MCD5330558.1 DUF2235 domain-containing protein [Chromobacterium piscinae]